MENLPNFFEKVLKAAFVAGSITVGLNFLSKIPEKTKAVRGRGVRYLVKPNSLKLLYGLGISICFCLPIISALIEEIQLQHIFLGLILFFMGALFFWASIDLFFCKTYWDKKGVYWVSLFGEKKCIFWNERPRFGGSSTIHSPYIQGKSAKIKYSEYYGGVRELEKMVARARRV